MQQDWIEQVEQLQFQFEEPPSKSASNEQKRHWRVGKRNLELAERRLTCGAWTSNASVADDVVLRELFGLAQKYLGLAQEGSGPKKNRKKKE